MLRMLTLLIVGYGFYRAGRDFIAGIPSEFKPVRAKPANGRPISAKRSTPAAKRSTKASPATTH